MVVHLRRRDDDGKGRATVVAGRKVGPATRRNRAKRRLRAALRDIGVPAGCDVVVVARAGALTAPFPSLQAELAELLGRAAQRYGSDMRGRRT